MEHVLPTSRYGILRRDTDIRNSTYTKFQPHEYQKYPEMYRHHPTIHIAHTANFNGNKLVKYGEHLHRKLPHTQVPKLHTINNRILHHIAPFVKTAQVTNHGSTHIEPLVYKGHYL